MRRVLVTVTQQDIDAARQVLTGNVVGFRCQNCPVALAVKRRLPEYAATIAAGPETVSLSAGNLSMSLPRRAQKFILDFDAEDREVRPFKFYGTITTLADRRAAAGLVT